MKDPTPANYCCAPCVLRDLWEGYGMEPDKALTIDAQALRDILRALVDLGRTDKNQLVRAAEALRTKVRGGDGQ